VLSLRSLGEFPRRGRTCVLGRLRSRRDPALEAPPSMSDRGLSFSLQAIHRQLAAMPCARYLIRLIHHRSRRPFPGSRLWTAPQLGQEATVKFLRARNREGYDVYFQPYAFRGNAGYILIDLDQAEPGVLDAMCAQGHQPCVVIETSPGHLQAWVHVSTQPLLPAVASAIGRELARLYHGDPASTDWRHVGRLAGFTNQKPRRRLPSGLAPWVKLRHATPGLARHSYALLQSGRRSRTFSSAPPRQPLQGTAHPVSMPPAVAVPSAAAVYQSWLQRLRIPQRFPQSGLEHRRPLDRPRTAAVRSPRRRGENHPPGGQPRFSTAPRGARRLFAAHPHPRPHRDGRCFSCAPHTRPFAVSPPRAPCVMAGGLCHTRLLHPIPPADRYRAVGATSVAAFVPS